MTAFARSTKNSALRVLTAIAPAMRPRGRRNKRVVINRSEINTRARRSCRCSAFFYCVAVRHRQHVAAEVMYFADRELAVFVLEEADAERSSSWIMA